MCYSTYSTARGVYYLSGFHQATLQTATVCSLVCSHPTHCFTFLLCTTSCTGKCSLISETMPMHGEKTMRQYQPRGISTFRFIFEYLHIITIY